MAYEISQIDHNSDYPHNDAFGTHHDSTGSVPAVDTNQQNYQHYGSGMNGGLQNSYLPSTANQSQVVIVSPSLLGLQR